MPLVRTGKTQEIGSKVGFAAKQWLFYALTLLVAAHFAVAYVLVLTPAFDYQSYVYGLVDYPFRSRRFMAWVFHGSLFLGERLHFRQGASAIHGPIWWTEV